MNSQGMLFSLEAIISIVILIVALGLITYTVSSESPLPEYTTIINQSNKITTFYFNEEPLVESGENIVCGKIAQYDKDTQTILTKQICEGYE